MRGVKFHALFGLADGGAKGSDARRTKKNHGTYCGHLCPLGYFGIDAVAFGGLSEAHWHVLYR